MRTARRAALAAAALYLAAPAAAQDPLLTLPQAYKRVFENEWVKVVRVHYEPNEKLPAHAHTESAAAYVYLNNGGPVTFTHDYGAATRPATREGSFRLYRAITETHTVENTSALPSDFLRVEFKTEPLEANRMSGRYHREPHPAGELFEKTQFENAQIRATRYLVPAGKTLELKALAEPALFVALTAGDFRATLAAGTPATEISLPQGGVRWIPMGTEARVENAGSQTAELLRFDLKTKPQPLR
jgi:quercetin dioxygenase-like cupin family protein